MNASAAEHTAIRKIEGSTVNAETNGHDLVQVKNLVK